MAEPIKEKTWVEKTLEGWRTPPALDSILGKSNIEGIGQPTPITTIPGIGASIDLVGSTPQWDTGEAQGLQQLGHTFTDTDVSRSGGGIADTTSIPGTYSDENRAIIAKNAGTGLTERDVLNNTVLSKPSGIAEPFRSTDAMGTTMFKPADTQGTYALQNAQQERANDPNAKIADIENQIRYSQEDMRRLQNHLDRFPADKVAATAMASKQQALSEMTRDYMGLIGKPDAIELAKAQEARLASEQGKASGIAERKMTLEEGMSPTEKALKEAQANWYSGKSTQANALAEKAKAEATQIIDGKFALPTQERNYLLYRNEQIALGKTPMERLDWSRENNKTKLADNPLVMLLNKESGGIAPTTSTGRTVVRTGTSNNRKVVQYSDGSIEYAP
jgi:hypothetical protein